MAQFPKLSLWLVLNASLCAMHCVEMRAPGRYLRNERLKSGDRTGETDRLVLRQGHQAQNSLKGQIIASLRFCCYEDMATVEWAGPMQMNQNANEL